MSASDGPEAVTPVTLATEVVIAVAVETVCEMSTV